MNDDELLKLAECAPETVEATTQALARVTDFQNGRGAMLRSLHLDPLAPATQLKDPS